MSTVPRLALLLGLLPCAARAEQPAMRTAPPATTQATTQTGLSVEAYFTPKDDIVALMVKRIDAAERTLDVAAYTFSHRDVASAIIRAHERGVKIRFLMDYTQSRLVTCRAIDLIEAGIEVRTRRRRGFQHNKYLIIDGAIVVTGSFNFAPSAQAYNAENVVVFRHAPQIVAAFTANHERILKDTLVKGK